MSFYRRKNHPQMTEFQRQVGALLQGRETVTLQNQGQGTMAMQTIGLMDCSPTMVRLHAQEHRHLRRSIMGGPACYLTGRVPQHAGLKEIWGTKVNMTKRPMSPTPYREVGAQAHRLL